MSIFILLITSVSFAQTDPKTYQNQLKFSPVRFIDLINPGIELNYERFHKKKFSSQLSVAYLNNVSRSAPYESYNGYRLSFEEKFFYRTGKRGKFYLSVELVYSKTKTKDFIYFINRDTLGITTKKSYDYVDTIGVNREAFIFNSKWGAQFLIKRLVIDFSAGLGLKYKETEHFDRLIPTDQMVKPRPQNAYYIAMKEGKSFKITIPVNIKIGYLF